jgi:hypothetical protein
MFIKLVLIILFTFCSYLNLNCIEKDFDLTLFELQKVLNFEICDLDLTGEIFPCQISIFKKVNKNNYLSIDIYSIQIKKIQDNNNFKFQSEPLCKIDSTIKVSILNSKIDSIDIRLKYFDEENYKLFLEQHK